MQPRDLTIEVCDGDLKRVGQIPRRFWADVVLVLRHRNLGTWNMSLPAELAVAQRLAEPGAGILVTGPQGVLCSGPMETATTTESRKDPRGTIVFSGFDHMVLLDDEEAFPDPSEPDVDEQTQAYDVRSGPAETVIRGFIDDNIGPSAPAARRTGLLNARLTLEPDEGRGSTVRAEARFDQLGPFLLPLGRTGGIGYRIIQEGSDLVLRFYVPADKSKKIRLDVANGRLASTEYAVKAPTITRSVVAGQGEGVDRTFIERTSADSIAAEAAWRRSIRRFRDQRQTDELDQLEQAGDEALADGGRTTVTTRLVPADDHTMRFGIDWGLGDIVSAVVGGVETPQVVSTVGISIRKDGVRTVARVGE